MGLFDELVNEVAEADRAVLEKYPKVKEKIVELDDFVGKWERWKASNWDPQANTTRQSVELLRQKDTEIEALRALQGTDMTWDDIKANVQAEITANNMRAGALTRDAFEKEVLPKLSFAQAEEVKKLEEAQKNLERGMEFTYAKTAHFPMKYMKDFGDVADAPEFTVEGLFKHMTDNKISDFQAGYDSLTAPLRTKKQEEQSKKREEDIRREEREKTQKEMMMKAGSLPVDERGPSAETTALSRRIADRKKIELKDAPKLTAGTIGDGSGTQDMYQAWLRDQANGGRPVQ